MIQAIAVALIAVGCSENPLKRQPISGTVAFDEKPLDYGVISFTSQGGANHSTGATIKNGEYAIPAEKGLPPGTYRVQINATIHDPKLPPPPAGQRDERPGIEIIPPSYNAESQVIIEVKEEPALDVNFSIPTR